MEIPEDQLAESRALLGVGAGATSETIQRAYLQKSYTLIRAEASQAERDRLKAAAGILSAHLAALERMQRASVAPDTGVSAATPRATASAAAAARARDDSTFDLASFDSRLVNAVMPPLVAGAAVLVQLTPLAFFLAGFHVWIHEFGHATVAWLTGYRALPLPIGWTSVSPERANFVYFGVLFLLGVLFVAGARERKIMPMLAAVALAVVQYHMTWRMPEQRAELWRAFAGVGGEFYLSAAMIGLFYFRLPEKFRWGLCRYVFLFIGAGAFFKSWHLWKRIKRGEEGIPYGTMVHGDEDAGGDMNILHTDHGWTQREIIHTYNGLADACVLTLAMLYLVFVLRLDRLVARVLPGKTAEAGT